MSQIKGAAVLITGGASGIGKIMGKICIEKGARALIIWDVNQQKLDETLQEFRASGFPAYGYIVDVANTDFVVKTARENLLEHGPVDILINNAGIVVGKFFTEHSHAEIDRTMQVNSQALMHVTLEFLPAMIRRQQGHIVNISSAAGMAANPQMSIYVASKWAILGWGETLRLELESQHKGLHVTSVTPFYVGTGMFKGVRSPIVPIVRPESAARQIIRAIEKNRIYCRMPWIVYAMPFFKGILPQRWYDTLIGKWFGIYDSMRAFQGHNR
jgi:short-subunit dehydrogenase